MSNGILGAACCCTPDQIGGCPKWMGSTYLVTDIGGAYEFSFQNSCRCNQGVQEPPEVGYIERTLTVSYSQVAPAVVELREGCCNPGSVCSCCCYRATGYMQVSWTLTVSCYSSFCDASTQPCPTIITPACGENQEVVLVVTNTYTGIAVTPFCLDIIRASAAGVPTGPACNGFTPSTAEAWIHRLSICGFPMQGSIEACPTPPIGGGGGPYCPCTFSFTNPPYGAYCRGASIPFVSNYEPLNTIANSDAAFLGYCFQMDARCGNPLGTEVECTSPTISSCLPCTDTDSGIYGPFALAFMEEFGGQDPRPNCLVGGGLGTANWSFQSLNYPEGYDPCDPCGPSYDGDAGDPCFSVLIGARPGFWRYI